MIPDITSVPAKVDPNARSKELDEKSKLKLQKAVKDFESLFVNYLLQNMRKTIQKSEGDELGFGGDLMQGMFDLEISKYVSRGSSLGIGEMLYRQMTGEPLPKQAVGSGRQVPSGLKAAKGVPEVLNGLPETAPSTLSKVGSAPLEQQQPANAQRGENESKELLRGQGPASSKPMPGPFAPVFNPSFAVTSIPDHVRVARVAAEPASPNLPQRLGQYENIIRQASDTFDISPNLIKAVIAAESSGNARAVSPKSAKGVMQLIDSTASAMGVTDVWNPKENIFGGSKYLKQQLDRFSGDIKLALASYNAGPGAVEKHGGVPPFNETRRYVERVMSYLQLFEQNGVTGNEKR